ncbi:hypothetical protein RDV89_01625 [Nocardioides zeae]|uniref:Integral membrane protein n=1 Tax=Nocardioides imazamoxiresistens TaxID=3231893 RepID=A0ABU3PRA5_9ACTN|nr:hypothetical protein [Nocardioides zeae]MDT9591749.1 hypothetical protein [Nocardioides zeae]
MAERATTTSETPTEPAAGGRGVPAAALVGLVAASLLVAAAFAVPPLFDWQVWARSERAQAALGHLPPVHGVWQPGLGVGTIPALLIAVAGVVWGPRLAARVSWSGLLAGAYAVALAWLFALALVDGESGLTRKLGADDEYLPTARSVDDVGAFLTGFVDRIPQGSEGQWPTHVAGHPPGATLFFVVLDRIGLGGDLAAAVVVVALAATLPLAVLVTLRALDAEGAARTVAPFLVLTPAAVYLGVSGDAVIAVVVAWGLACLALGARAGRAPSRRWLPLLAWSALAGVLLGNGVFLSYGMPLIGLVAVAVLVVARSWRPLPVAVVAALGVTGAYALGGFAWWEAYPVLVERYWDGLASDRPMTYWWWGNLAALLVSAGLAVGAGVGAWAARVGGALRVRTAGGPDARALLWLGGAGLACVVGADVSGMSKAEVERIWLPFVPWLTLTLALLPARWRTPALALQVTAALVVQHLLYTSW